MALCKLNSIQKGHHAVSELGWAQCWLHVVGWDGMHAHELPLGWPWALFFLLACTFRCMRQTIARCILGTAKVMWAGMASMHMCGRLLGC